MGNRRKTRKLKLVQVARVFPLTFNFLELDSPLAQKPDGAIEIQQVEDPDESELADNPYVLSNKVSIGVNSFVDSRQPYD